MAPFRHIIGNMKSFTTAAILALTMCLEAAEPQIVRIWPKGIPNSWPAPTGPEKTEERGKDGVKDRAVSNVTDPTIEVYLPEPAVRNGAAVLIAPGGGYVRMAYDKEGVEVARWLNSIGIAGIVLKYRLPELPKDPGERRTALFGDAAVGAKIVRVSVEDASEAMNIIRSNAAKWNIDKDRVGMMGFSAGGHLAALMGVQESEGVRPNFLGLIYAAIPEKIQVGKDTPQSFFVHASDDPSVPTDSSIHFYQALRKQKIPAELHIFSEGGHGFGIKKSGKTSEHWPARFEAWFKAMKCPCEN